MPQRKQRNFWQKWGWTFGVVLLAVVLALQTQFARDLIKGFSYRSSELVKGVQSDLALTGYGNRVFAATKPELEGSKSFNDHCSNVSRDTNVLGCYLPNDDRIYVYEVTLDELKVSHKSTLAHELLHAIWERFSEGDKRKLEPLLEAEYQKHEAEMGEILAYYEAENRSTELFARVGTEIAEISPELEKYYARVFEDRQKIVNFYQEYAKPMNELKEKIEALKTEILSKKSDIATKRTEYEKRFSELESAIRDFNACAKKAGCFTTSSFTRERQALEAEQTAIEEMREALNQEIVENNERIKQFNEYQEQLGILNDAMDSTTVLEE